MGNEDKRDIDALVEAFFSAFSNRAGRSPDLARLFTLCIPQAIVTKAAGDEPVVADLETFIRPRQLLLCGGGLTDFHEVETSETTILFGNVAQRASTYAKSGRLHGVPFATRGFKTFQFVRGPQGWRIASVAWDDERDGLTLREARVSGRLDLE
jgi:hypothetical protein